MILGGFSEQSSLLSSWGAGGCRSELVVCVWWGKWSPLGAGVGVSSEEKLVQDLTRDSGGRVART